MVVITLIGFLYLGGKFVRSYDRSSTPTNFRSFTVTGDGKAVGVPDIAEFSFDVISEGGTDIATLQSHNAEKMNKTIDFVKKQGIDPKDITTSQYSIQPRYDSTNCVYGSGKPCPPAQIVGYTIQQTTQIKIRDFKLISPLLAGVVTSGANTVSNLQFSIDDPTTVENTARAEAMKKAADKAKSLAAAGGFSLGRILDISENTTTPYSQPQPMMAMDKAVSVGSVAPTIEAGSQEVDISMSVKYEIQ